MMVYRHIVLLPALTLFIPYTVWYTATPGVFAFHAFVSTSPAGRRRHATTTQTPRCPSSVLRSSPLTELDEEAAVEIFQQYWQEEYKFDTLLSVTIHNGTYDDKLWGFFPWSRPITRPSSHVRVQIHHDGNVDVSAFRPTEDHQRQCFTMSAARNERNISMSIYSWGYWVGNDKVGFTCDAIEITSLSGPLGRFSTSSGGKYNSQLLNGGSSSNHDDSRDTVVVKSEKNERLAYNKGDVILEVTLDRLYDPLRGTAFRDELAELGWKTHSDEDEYFWKQMEFDTRGEVRELMSKFGSLSGARAASEDLANMTWEIWKLMFIPSSWSLEKMARAKARMDELRRKWG